MCRSTFLGGGAPSAPSTVPWYQRRSSLDEVSGGCDGGIRARLAGDRLRDDDNNDDDDDDASIVVALHILMHLTGASGEPSISRRLSAGGVSATTTMTTIPTTTTTTMMNNEDGLRP
jgi:hypothetical protein